MSAAGVRIVALLATALAIVAASLTAAGLDRYKLAVAGMVIVIVRLWDLLAARRFAARERQWRCGYCGADDFTDHDKGCPNDRGDGENAP